MYVHSLVDRGLTMKFSKITAVAVSLVVFAAISVNAQQRSESSVESQYFNDADGVIIMSLASSDVYDNKIVALQYLQTAIENGNTSEQVVAAIGQLAGEGVNTQVRQNGRLTNNFPDIRREACLLLAKIPTEHSKNTLLSITAEDREPMVLAAAVRSLGEIGINKNDEVVDAITFANKRNQSLNPTSSFAYEVLVALEKLAPTTENKRMIIDAAASIASDYHYVTPVRNRALALIKSMSSSAAN